MPAGSQDELSDEEMQKNADWPLTQ